ncbi:hypothetical protein C0583_05005 [Candidatus Parcubacteria bacterium]|nr:MAG: hypothetical protein C0583_05005 [Candidatus Parcubacteria bacterium]
MDKLEFKYKELFSKMFNGFALHKVIVDENNKPIDYSFVDVNPAYEKLTGLKKTEIINKTVREVIPGIEKEEADWIGRFGKIALFGGEDRFEDYVKALGGWYRIYVFSPEKNYFAVIIDDISDIKKSQKVIKEKDGEYKQLLDRTDDLIAIIEAKQKPNFLYVNQAHNRTLGYTPEDLKGKNILEFIHPEDQAKIFSLLSVTLKDVEKKNKTSNDILPSIKIDYRFKRNDGSYAYIDSTADVVGERIFVVSRDISKTKEDFEKLKIEKEKSEMYLNIAGSIIMTLDKKGIVTLINEQGCEILGDKRDNIIGKKWLENFIPAEERALIKEVHQGLTKQQNDYSVFENGIINKKGEKRFVSWRNTLLYDKEGKVIGSLSSGIDITELKNKEKEMKELVSEWSETFDSMSDSITIHDKNFVILNVNKAACELLRMKKEEMIGKKCFSVFHKEDKPVKYCPLAVSKETRKREQMEYYEEGLGKWLSIVISPVFDNGNVVKYIHIARDITENKEAEKEIIERNNELEKINKLSVGRELKMIELKRENKDLKEKIAEKK